MRANKALNVAPDAGPHGFARLSGSVYFAHPTAASPARLNSQTLYSPKPTRKNMPSETAPEAEVEAAIEQFFHAMDTQNFALMEQLVAHDADMVHIGTDTDEIWRGWDELKEATVEQFEGLEHYTAQVRDLIVKVSHAGDVAWYSHLLDAQIKSNGKGRTWRGARFTGVFEKRNGRWVMMQTHVSIPESEQDGAS